MEKNEDLKIKTPLNDYVVLRTELTEEVTSGGIIIPNTAREETGVGVILEVSPDLKNPNVKKNDKVVYRKGKHEKLTEDSENSTFEMGVRYSDIIGILEK